MADWRFMTTHPPLDDANQILPWIPAARKDVPASEITLVITISVLFVAGAMIASDTRRVAAMWRWCMTRHLFFRAPFYHFFGIGWAGLPGRAGG